MPSYTVNDGHRAIIGRKLVEAGDKVSLDAAVGDRLVADGIVTAVRRGRPPGAKRSAWTPADDESDGDDDGEG